MLSATANSVNGVPIRLTKERWKHIINSHPEISQEDLKEILNSLSKPDMVLKGDLDELLAVKKKSDSRAWIVIPYKEIDQNDGFVLTAYLTTDASWLLKKEVLWNKE